MPREVVHIADLDDLPPGRMRYAEVDGLPIALANVGGRIYAFSDTCRHEGGPLSAGVLIGDTVTCPWHGWTYSVRTGRAIVPPIGIRIPTYETIVEEGAVFVVVDWPDP
jgi:nitrite reductase/ring-hydroxylating ferredoxin subunit